MRNGGTEISPLIGRYCLTTPPPIVSQGNHMFIKYFTDVDSPNNGFKAVVKIGNTFMFCKIWFQKLEKILINIYYKIFMACYFVLGHQEYFFFKRNKFVVDH